MKSCPPEDRLEQLLDETLSLSERDAVSLHVAACDTCQKALERLTEAPRSIRGALSTAHRPTNGLSVQLLHKLEQAPPRSTASPPGEFPLVPGYRLLEELGRGGMGVVYRAVHDRLNRTVALKIILAGAHAGRREVTRFEHEAMAVAKLHHPNIVQIFEFVKADGHSYCALELIEGGSLVQYLDGKPQPAERAARLLEVLARTIHFAHERGIVHRDLKPANILLDCRAVPNGTPSNGTPTNGNAQPTLSDYIPKISDFGLAKQLDEQGHATGSGEVIGTPSYMAPEQAGGPQQIGPLADVYALGAILYEMLTGHPPFKGATAVDTLVQVLNEEPVRPSRLHPEIPRDLETICLKCLEKSPAQRYSSALELAEDLRRFRRGDPVLARPVGPQERFWKWVRRRPTTAVLIAGIIGATMMGFAGVTWQWRETASARDEAMQANQRARAALYRLTIAQSQLRWRLNDFTGAQSSLRSWLEKFNRVPGQEDPRSWEWTYLEGLYSADLLTMKHPEGGNAGSVVVSPDGKQVASTITGRREVRVWSAEDGRLLFILPAAAGAQRLAYSPDGKLLAVGDNTGSVTVWELAKRKRTDHQVHSDAIVGLAFSPNSELLATASWDKTVKVQKALSGTLCYPALAHKSRVHSVAFRPKRTDDDLDVLAVGDQDGQVHLWNARTGKEWDMHSGRDPAPQPLTGHKSAVYGVAFSPSGRSLASAGSNGNVRIWDLSGWLAGLRGDKPSPVRPRVIQSLTNNAGAALGIAYSPDGRYLAFGCSDSTARVWYLSSGVLRVIFRGHKGPVEMVRFGPNGRRLYSCCPEEGAVKVWDVTRPPEYSTLARTQHPEYPSQDPRGTWREVKVCDLLRNDAGPVKAATGPDVEALAFKADGKQLVSVTVGGKLQTWDTDSGMLLDEKPDLPLNPHLVSPAVLADFSPDGERLAARRNKPDDKGRVVSVWHLSPLREVLVLTGHRYPVFGVRFSGDGRYLATVACDRPATGRPHEIKVWHADTGKLLGGWEGHGQVFCLAFSPDGKFLATGGEDGLVEVMDWARGKMMPIPHEHKKAVTALAFSRDGKLLASAGSGDESVRVWDTNKWREQARAIEATGILCDLAFSHDGKRLAGISRDVVKLWDVQKGEELLTLRGAPQRHRDPAFNPRLAFSPDGKRLAGSNWDESISVWESEAPSEERQQARRLAAERRAPLWHLQEAEHCLLAKPRDPFAAHFHLDHIGSPAEVKHLPLPLQERISDLRKEENKILKKPPRMPQQDRLPPEE